MNTSTTAQCGSEIVGENDWLIVKRGLYFKPERKGYTGIRDLAGRYSLDEAKDYADDADCSMVRFSEAPEFSSACYPDLAVAHMQGKVAKAQSELAAARKALEASRAAMLRTRTASIAGCEEGYGKPQLWAEELFASHGDLTKAIKLCDAALSSKEPEGK